MQQQELQIHFQVTNLKAVRVFKKFKCFLMQRDSHFFSFSHSPSLNNFHAHIHTHQSSSCCLHQPAIVSAQDHETLFLCIERVCASLSVRWHDTNDT